MAVEKFSDLVHYQGAFSTSARSLGKPNHTVASHEVELDGTGFEGCAACPGASRRLEFNMETGECEMFCSRNAGGKKTSKKTAHACQESEEKLPHKMRQG